MFALRNEKGLVLPVVLIMLAVVTAMGGAAVVLTRTDLKVGANYKSSKRAFYIAEGGLNRGWSELANGTNDFTTVAGYTSPQPLFSSEPLGDGSYTVTAGPGSGPNLVEVISTGCLPADCAPGSAKSAIEAVFRRNASLFQHALLAKETIMLSGGAITDSFDSRISAYSAGTAGSEGHIGLNGDIIVTGSPRPSIVNGDATAGTDIRVTGRSKIIRAATAGGTIPPPVFVGPGSAGGVTPKPNFTIPPVNSPCGSSYSSGAGITVTPGGSYGLSNGDLTVDGGSEITLASGIYCLKSVYLKGGGAKLTVDGTGPVTIYLTEHSDFSGGSIVNTTEIASNLQIFSSVDAGAISNPRDWAPGIELSGGSQAYMTIYAPDAKIEFSGRSGFFGSVVGKVIDNNGGSQIHYDKELEGDPSAGIELVSWKEVF